ncbi:hypothetical protein HYH03_008521 [Edaphochlamys debaryana]|uniref:Transcriptional coactivator p15 (PC4) C-terminal domain-containing protein n=1 Tax=Edaphochlamys debaryana TaxID=47281 RepID=A0A836BZG8_9CHLO|nr:hypothetical protein HYH03_008521 [Edaphochlamys debaryana]|eukprot:KAG2493393.1 hypothetical protein HYH03_008521 [Edaphochlamys debaryana]
MNATGIDGPEPRPQDGGRKRAADDRGAWLDVEAQSAPAPRPAATATASMVDDGAHADHGEGRGESGPGVAEQRAAKRGRGDGAGSGGGAVAQAAVTEAGDQVLLRVMLSVKVAATVQRWKGHNMVDVRECYLDEYDEVKFKNIGLALRLHEFDTLAGLLPSLLRSLKDRRYMRAALSDKRAAEVAICSPSCPWYCLKLQEHDRDGKRNAVRGINLQVKQTTKLLEAGESIRAMAALLPSPPPPPPVEAPRSAGGGGNGGSGRRVYAASQDSQLGPKKRAFVSRVEGSLVVRMEESFKPRNAERKGISLSPATVAASVPAVSEALGRRDVAFSVQLSGSRRVSISNWNGTTYVQVREYYEQGGKQLPSNKGLGMNPFEWAALAAAAEGLSAALASRS